MVESDQGSGYATVVQHIRDRVAAGQVRITQHAQQEMVEDEILLDDLLSALAAPEVLEDYPGHRRGACCLVLGVLPDGGPVRAVCTTSLPILVVITVYRPMTPKWVTPRERGQRQ